MAFIQSAQSAPVYFHAEGNEGETLHQDMYEAVMIGVDPLSDINRKRTLYIQSALDLESFEPLLRAFVQRYPNITVAYEDINTLELYKGLLEERGKPKASLVISSAMDLQLKLVNDGFAEEYISFETEQLPSYAKWRNQIFAFSKEPIVLVVNRDSYPNRVLPDDREALLASIRQNDAAFIGRIGTYDIRSSGVGYMLASQDARQANTMWGRLLEAFGSHQVRSYCCTGEMIDDVAKGELIVAYNLLGSYAARRVEADVHLAMVVPKDYTLMVMRTAIIPKGADNYADAGRFLDFILTDEAQEIMSSQKLLYPILTLKTEPQKAFTLPLGPTRVIELDQQLLVGQDSIKKKRFIEEWRSALEIGELP